jgi:hypothetical protein
MRPQVFQGLQHPVTIQQRFLVVLQHLPPLLAELIDIKKAKDAKQHDDNEQEDQPQR